VQQLTAGEAIVTKVPEQLIVLLRCLHRTLFAGVKTVRTSKHAMKEPRVGEYLLLRSVGGTTDVLVQHDIKLRRLSHTQDMPTV
jgi:hypothetical protein